MAEPSSRQKQLLTEEIRLMQSIDTYESCIETLIQMIAASGAKYHAVTLEEVILAIHRMQTDSQIELCFVRLEKALLLSLMKGGGDS